MRSLGSFDEVRITTGIAFVRKSPLDRLQDLEAIHFGKFQIEQNQPGQSAWGATAIAGPAENKIQRLLASSGYLDRVGQPMAPQGVNRQLDVGRVVVDEENFDRVIRRHCFPPDRPAPDPAYAPDRGGPES